MIELKDEAIKEYKDIPAVRISPLIQKIDEVLCQECLNKQRIRYRFGGIDSLAWKITDKRFRRGDSPKEAHSYPYLLQHKEFEVSKSRRRSRIFWRIDITRTL